MNISQIEAALLAAALTATVTLLAVHLANRGNLSRLTLQLQHEVESRRKELYQKKLEELYVLASVYGKSLASHYFPYLTAMEGRISYNEALDMTVDKLADLGHDFDRLEMLVNVYFPSIEEVFVRLLECRSRANEIVGAFKSEYQRGRIQDAKAANRLLRAMTDIETQSRELKAAISSMSKEI